MIMQGMGGCAPGPATWRDMPPWLVCWRTKRRMATVPEGIGRRREALMAPLKKRERVD